MVASGVSNPVSTDCKEHTVGKKKKNNNKITDHSQLAKWTKWAYLLHSSSSKSENLTGFQDQRGSSVLETKQFFQQLSEVLEYLM